LSKTPLGPGEWKEPLEAKKNAEGAVILKWPEPVGATPVAFYRIYRGSTNYSSRYAIVSPATRTFTDTDTETAHQYWVTAVSETMTESPFLGKVEL
jgi:fibronectin type 3 domain-containing protein